MMYGKKRIACENCRKSKIKCDQHKPNCGQCNKKNRICIYLPQSYSASSNYEANLYITNIRIQHKIPITNQTTLRHLFLSSNSNRLWTLRIMKGSIYYHDPKFLWVRHGRITESMGFLKESIKPWYCYIRIF